jgi:hypothetical protein
VLVASINFVFVFDPIVVAPIFKSLIEATAEHFFPEINKLQVRRWRDLNLTLEFFVS